MTTETENSNGKPAMDKAAESEARKEKLAEEAISRIRGGAHWLDWMMVGDWLAVGQEKAMRLAGTNRPYGKAFTRAFGLWLKEHPTMNDIDSGTRSHLLWAIDRRSEIEAWREKLAPNERAKLNHPTAIKRRFEAAHRIAASDPNAPKKETKVEALVRENEELWTRVKRLERESKGDGSLFDLRNDKVEDIGQVIEGTVSYDRLNRLAKDLTARAAKRKPKAHAG
jgi:hypothetical protein